MRLLHVTRDYAGSKRSPIRGGISVAVGGLVRALSSMGSRGSMGSIENVVVSLDGWRPFGRSGTRAKPSPEEGEGAWRLGAGEDLTSWLAGMGDVDHVVVHEPLAWDATGALRARGVGSSYCVHVAHRHQRELRGLVEPSHSELAEARALLEADVVLVPSAALASLVHAQAPHTRVEVAPFGIDAPPATPPPRPFGGGKAAARDPVVLFVGRFSDVKGIAELVAAIPLVSARAPHARFVVAGGLPENPKAEARWRRRFAALGDAVEVTGWLDRDALEARYREALVVVAPSWHETFGFAVAEAMARGIAVVASSTGGLSDLVDDGSGVLVPPRDVAALAAALIRLLDDPDAARALGRAAAQKARAFRWEARVERWQQIVASFALD
jgi:glycosyltransferase involved in cell wall biosynthesis